MPIVSNFSLLRFLVTNMLIFRGTNYNSFLPEIVSYKGHYTRHNPYNYWTAQKLEYTAVDIYCTWQIGQTDRRYKTD